MGGRCGLAFEPEVGSCLYACDIDAPGPSKPTLAERFGRQVLRSPAFVRRAAATQAKDPQERSDVLLPAPPDEAAKLPPGE